MPFQIRPVKEFLVRPALPPAIARMSDLAYNVLWSWDHTVRSLFRRLDAPLWKNCGHNPVLMLGRVPQATLERAAADSRFLAAYRKACDRYSSYVERTEEPVDDVSAEDIEHRARLFRLVERLPADQRQVVLKRFAEQRSVREIATSLGRSEGAVKQLQFRGLQTLRALLSERDA